MACTLGRVSRVPALRPVWQRTGRAGQVSLRSGHLLAYALIPTGTEDPERAGSGPSLAWSPGVRAPSPRQSNWAQISLDQLQG